MTAKYDVEYSDVESEVELNRLIEMLQTVEHSHVKVSVARIYERKGNDTALPVYPDFPWTHGLEPDLGISLRVRVTAWDERDKFDAVKQFHDESREHKIGTERERLIKQRDEHAQAVELIEDKLKGLS